MRRHRRLIAAGVLRPRRFVGRGVFRHGKFDDWNVKHPHPTLCRRRDGRQGVRRLCRECRQLFGGTASLPTGMGSGSSVGRVGIPMGSTELGAGGLSPLPGLLTPNPSAPLMTLTPLVGSPNPSAPVSTLGSTPTTGTSPLVGTGTPSIDGRPTSFGRPLPTRPF